MLFNIYYINFPKVYEIKMMMSNVIGSKIEMQSDATQGKEEEIKAKLGTQVAYQCACRFGIAHKRS